MENEELKLKPCPFCGGKANALLGYGLLLDGNGNKVDFYEESEIWFGACVYCPNCGCEIEKKKRVMDNTEQEWYDQIKQDAVEAWNRREKDAE